jgi:hypothetical protein
MADPSRNTFPDAVSKSWRRIVYIQKRILLDNELNEMQDRENYERQRLADILHFSPSDTIKCAIVNGLQVTEQRSPTDSLTISAGQVYVEGILVDLPQTLLPCANHSVPVTVYLELQKYRITAADEPRLLTHPDDPVDVPNGVYGRAVAEREKWVFTVLNTQRAQDATAFAQVYYTLLTYDWSVPTATYAVRNALTHADRDALYAHIGSRGVGVHAVATLTDDGFMSAGDRAALNTLNAHLTDPYAHWNQVLFALPKRMVEWHKYVLWKDQVTTPGTFFSSINTPIDGGSQIGLDGSLSFSIGFPDSTHSSWMFIAKIKPRGLSANYNLLIPVLSVDETARVFYTLSSNFPSTVPTGQHPMYLADSSWSQAALFGNSATKVVAGPPYNRNPNVDCFALWDLDYTQEYTVVISVVDSGGGPMHINTTPMLIGSNVRPPAGGTVGGSVGCVLGTAWVEVQQSNEDYRAKLIPLRDIKVGDFIRGQEGFVEVYNKIEVVHSERYVIITKNGRMLYCTGTHPVATASLAHPEFVVASELELGMKVVTSAGLSEVETLMVENTAPAKYYDLSVGGLNAFFADGVLVHNKLIMEPVEQDQPL